MCYGNLFMEFKVCEMVEVGCDKILFFLLYLYYVGLILVMVNDQFFCVLMKEIWQLVVWIVLFYFEDVVYVDVLVQLVIIGYSKFDFELQKLVCFYYGLFKCYLMEGDFYYCQCVKMMCLLKEVFKWDDDKIMMIFQFKFGLEEWLKLYIVEEVVWLVEDGVKNIVVIVFVFLVDCIEIFEEINEEICDSFIEVGGENFVYILCLNDDVVYIVVLIGVIK